MPEGDLGQFVHDYHSVCDSVARPATFAAAIRTLRASDGNACVYVGTRDPLTTETTNSNLGVAVELTGQGHFLDTAALANYLSEDARC